MNERFLVQGPSDARFTILLAHGAGAPMDSPSMTAASTALAESSFRVARFEFGTWPRAARLTTESLLRAPKRSSRDTRLPSPK